MAPEQRARRAAHELRNALQILYSLLEQPRVQRPHLIVERGDVEAVKERILRAVRLLEAR